MSTGKKGALLLYAILAILAVTQAGTQIGSVVNWIIMGLVVVHALEVVIFFNMCRKAGGSLGGHLLQLFVFGYFHMKEIKQSS